MKIFLSSTFADLVQERQAVLLALRKKRRITIAMEDFPATSKPPLHTALESLRECDLVLLVIGGKAGTLLPDDSGSTYTSAEYEELLKLGKEALVFLKEQTTFWNRRPKWRNQERNRRKKKALDAFKARVGSKFTWATFSTPEQLALAAIHAIDDWEC